jgi:uncharacterized protein YcgI (DUF1989 family)
MTGRLIKPGQVIRIIDVEGQQVASCIIWDANNFDNVLSCTNTRGRLRRWNGLPIGSGLYSKNGDKLATISDDTTGGIHPIPDSGIFCNEAANRVRYGIPGTINCLDNLVAAMACYQFSARDIDWGSCITFFMNLHYEPDRTFEIRETHTKPGDYVDLMAEMDIIVAISNCPDERSACTAYNPTSLQAVIFEPNRDYKAKVKALSEPSN